jgi:hypothetical protein
MNPIMIPCLDPDRPLTRSELDDERREGYPAGQLERLREYAQRMELAETREDLDALYVDIVGYSLLEDEPDATEEHLRDMCDGFLREECYSLGIHCDDVFNPCVTDGTRSNGPWGRA